MKKKLVKDTVTTALFLADIMAVIGAYGLALFTVPLMQAALNYFFSNTAPLDAGVYSIKLHDLLFVWLSPLVLFMFYTRGHYTQRVPWWGQVQQILMICAFALMVDGFFRFALDLSFSKILILFSWFYAFFLFLLGRQIVFFLLKRTGGWNMPAIVIGDIETVINTLCAFRNDPYTGYDVDAIYLRDSKDKEFSMDMLHARYANIKVEREFNDYAQLIRDNPDHFFVVTLESFRGAERDEIIRVLTETKALFAIVPPVSRVSLFEMEPRYYFGHDIMLMHVKQTIFTPWGSFIKRAMDITVSGLALLLVSPLMLLVALFLKLEGQGGSIFYGGYRIGKNGHRFKCWKFRSMEPNSDHLVDELLARDPEAKAHFELYRKLKHDPRITTKTAAIIRKASIDELPQLWNVLVGDMSLVGPRPILDNEKELFGDTINEYMRVRPGITGLWQVSGRNNVSFQRRIYWDGWYVRNWSLWGDCVILIKTLNVVFGRSGAY